MRTPRRCPRDSLHLPVPRAETSPFSVENVYSSPSDNYRRQRHRILWPSRQPPRLWCRHVWQESFSGKCNTISALPALVWVEIESSTMEIDRGLEMLDIAEATSRLLDPLDRRVEGFHTRIGDVMLQMAEHVGEVAPNELRDRRHRSQSTMGGLPEPTGKSFRAASQ